jgi:hypothetical protein
MSSNFEFLKKTFYGIEYIKASVEVGAIFYAQIEIKAVG